MKVMKVRLSAQAWSDHYDRLYGAATSVRKQTAKGN